VLLGLAYIGMAYVSWALAWVIAGRTNAPIAGARLVTLPLLAGAIMTAWDLAQDPVWATVLHGWVWLDGGPWFGVPVSNYLGWYANLFVIYLLFALYLRRNPGRSIAASRASWRPALIFYGLCAAGNVLQVESTYTTPALVQDPTGKLWRVADIIAGSALVSIFVMGGFAALAWINLVRQEKTATD
jgi:putative membrane protein